MTYLHDTNDTPIPTEDATPEERMIGGRTTPDNIYLIDRAALEVGVSRGRFLVDAAIEKARTVMAAKAAVGRP